jgi:hypothetical protein
VDGGGEPRSDPGAAGQGVLAAGEGVMEAVRKKEVFYCNFCGKDSGEVKLIAGPTVYICYECVDLCQDVKQQRGSIPGRPPISITSAMLLESILKDAVEAANQALERLAAYREELEKIEEERKP